MSNSGSTSKASRAVWNVSLDENLNDISCYIHPRDNPKEQWCIVIPQQMLQSLVCWFHQDMRHPWEKHWCRTLKQCYCHPKLRYMVDRLKCEYCQKHRLSGISYRSLPELVVWIAPWEEVVTDLIGLWTVKDNNRKVEFNALMCINAACKLV
jgi:hypothetical protein